MRRSRTPEQVAAWLCTAAALILAPACGGGDDEPAPECETELAVGITVDLEPLAAAPQIHPDVAFDGSALWLAYNLTDGEGAGNFDVFLRRIHCNGTLASESMRVTTTLGGNDIDPSIAVSDGVVAVAWNADSGMAPNNMDALFRTWGTDGEPVMTSDVILETSREGAPAPGNVMAPRVAALGNGEFAVAGVRGLDAAGTFQAFVQRVDADGALVGEAVDGQFEASVSHSGATVASTPEGDLYLAWVRSPPPDYDEDWVVHTALAAEANAVSPSPPATAIAGQMGSAPSYAAGADGNAYLAFGTAGTEYDIVLMDGSKFDGSSAAITLGTAGEMDHTPTVVASAGGGAVAWFRNVSGFRNRVVLQSFSFDGAAFAPGAEKVLETETAAPYAPAITYVRDGVYFVAWAEGQSPDLYLRGSFVQLD